MRPRPVRLFRPLALAALLVGTASAVIYNARADDLARDLLGGLTLTEGTTSGCDDFAAYLADHSFPKVANNKELVRSVSYVTSAPYAEVKGRVTRNAQIAGSDADWSGRDDYALGFFELSSLPGYTVPFYIEEDADLAGHTAVCFGIFKDQSAP